MRAIIQGLILGFVIVLPGMSGGTVFLIMGLYENLISDLVKLNIRPYIPIFGGILAGIFIGGSLFALVFSSYRDLTAIVLLGCLLASIRSVLAGCPRVSIKRFAFLAIGLLLGIIVVAEPLSIVEQTGNIDIPLLLVGGALSTAAMVLPGVPGSSVLIVLGLYDTMLYNIKELAVVPLLIFGAGSLLGLFLLVNLLDKLYAKYHDLLSYFFAGLILGSSRSLLPLSFEWYLIPPFVVSFLLLWWYSGRKAKTPDDDPKEDDLRKAKPALHRLR